MHQRAQARHVQRLGQQRDTAPLQGPGERGRDVAADHHGGYRGGEFRRDLLDRIQPGAPSAQVVIGEGDGWVRSYQAETGKKLWEFDTNARDAVWPKTRNTLIATPVIWGNRVYIANGQDPENGPGPGHLYAIDATKLGDITGSGRVWRYDGMKRSISTAAVAAGLVFAADIAGFLYCVDAETGKPYWTHDLLAVVWGSPMVVGGNVYLGDEDGDVAVLAAAKEKKLVAEMNMGSTVYATVVPANGTLFLTNRNQLWALAGNR